MNAPTAKPPTLGEFHLTPEEAKSALWRRFMAHVEGELQLKRRQNDMPMNIVDTTVLRGEIALLKRIQARTDEVGPGSRLSEPPGPESTSVRTVADISPGF